MGKFLICKGLGKDVRIGYVQNQMGNKVCLESMGIWWGLQG